MLRTYVRREVRLAALRLKQPFATISEPVAIRVLIVDDHPSFRASARAMLESEGFEIAGEASDGATAIEAVGSLHPDVVLLDVQLPDMSGFDVCALIDSANGAPPAIVLTSSRDEIDYGELVDDSCALGFVPKAELSGEAIATLIA